MATRADLPDWVLEALQELGGSAHAVDVARVVWCRHEIDLRASGDLFYTWQYDLRWAGTKLRKAGLLRGNERGERWALADRTAVYSTTTGAPVGAAELMVGHRYSRRELNARFGGQQQGGIITPKNARNILVLSSHKGRQFGYHDRWESGDTFRYFGQGQSGDMYFTRGNKAIRDSAKLGKSLLLFTCEDVKASTYRFEGSFRYDGFEWIAGNLGADGKPRRAICFRLVRSAAPL